MSDRERAIARLFADAGIRRLSELARLVDEAHPGLATEPTIHRYLWRPPKKLSYDILRAVAEQLEVSPDELRNIVTARYLGEANWPMPDDALELALNG